MCLIRGPGKRTFYFQIKTTGGHRSKLLDVHRDFTTRDSAIWIIEYDPKSSGQTNVAQRTLKS